MLSRQQILLKKQLSTCSSNQFNPISSSLARDKEKSTCIASVRDGRGSMRGSVNFSTMHQSPKIKQKPKLRMSFSNIFKGTMQANNEDLKNAKFDDLVQTEYDNDMRKLKFQCKSYKYLEKEKISELIYNKKALNHSKYVHRSTHLKNSQIQSSIVPKGSITITLNRMKKDFIFDSKNFKGALSAKSKFKMKWKTIQWLISYRKDAIQLLFDNYATMLKYARLKPDGFNRQEFGDLMSVVGLGADPNLINKLFYVFDDDQSQSVDYNEIIIGLEVLKENTMEEKMKTFFSLCQTDEFGNISQKELYKVLKQSITNYDDQYMLKKLIARIFEEMDLNGDGVIDNSEILIGCQKNNLLSQLLGRNFKNAKCVDKMIENDLKDQQNWVPLSAGVGRAKEGIHFGIIQNIFNALSENDDIQTKADHYKSLLPQE